eukprot:GHVT01022187.1.p1 GENE.GHVT01022187.1~~GHVT01022187.1.p1  ORF type:complete len:571 (+),score=58.25 GHVT01022187.1:1830-3542(+)
MRFWSLFVFLASLGMQCHWRQRPGRLHCLVVPTINEGPGLATAWLANGPTPVPGSAYPSVLCEPLRHCRLVRCPISARYKRARRHFAPNVRLTAKRGDGDMGSQPIPQTGRRRETREAPPESRRQIPQGAPKPLSPRYQSLLQRLVDRNLDDQRIPPEHLVEFYYPVASQRQQETFGESAPDEKLVSRESHDEEGRGYEQEVLDRIHRLAANETTPTGLALSRRASRMEGLIESGSRHRWLPFGDLPALGTAEESKVFETSCLGEIQKMDRHVTSILETIPSHLFDQGMFPPSFPREVSDFYFQYQNMTHTDIAAVDPRHLLLDFRRALLYHDRWIDTFVATRLAAQSPDMRRAQAQIESTMNGDDGGAFGSGSTESSESSNAIDLARTIADASSKGRAGPSTRQLISGLLSTPRDSYRFPKDAHIVKEERFSDDQSDYDDDDETATVLRQYERHFQAVQSLPGLTRRKRERLLWPSRFFEDQAGWRGAEAFDRLFPHRQGEYYQTVLDSMLNRKNCTERTKRRPLRPGQLVRGRVLWVTPKAVTVDVGGRVDGVLTAAEAIGEGIPKAK